MNYSKLTDIEINLAVGKLISRDSWSLVNSEGKACIHEFAEPVGNFGVMCLGWKVFDPCNSWADSGPIFEAEKISLHAPRFGEGWMAEFTGSDDDVNDGFQVDYHEAHDPNPLRAGLIVFLMMKDAENE